MLSIEEIKCLLEVVANEELVRFLKKEESNETNSIVLLLAAETGNIDILEYLLLNGCDVNVTDDHGRTPLIIALQNKRYCVANYLIQFGANYNVVDRRQESALTILLQSNAPLMTLGILIRASMNNHQNIACALLNHVRCKIYEAVLADLPIEVMDFFIRNGQDINTADPEFGRTPLHWAVIHKNVTAVNFLIERGGNTNAFDFDGYNPLYYIFFKTSNKNNDLLMSLVRRDRESVYSLTSRGLLQSYRAWRFGDIDAVRFLIVDQQMSNPARIFTKDLLDNSLLHYVSVNSHIEVIYEIVDYLLDIFDVNIPNQYGQTPLHWAAQIGNVNMMEFLLIRGANADLATYDIHLTPVMDLYNIIEKDVRKGHIQGIELLFQSFANPQMLVPENQWDILELAFRSNAKLDRIKPLLAYLALLKSLNVGIIESIGRKINAQPNLRDYFYECRCLLQSEVSNTDIKVLDLLSNDHKKMLVNITRFPILGKIDQLRSLPIFRYIIVRSSYYWKTIVKRTTIVLHYTEMKTSAAKALSILGLNKFEPTSLIVNNIFKYLTDKDLLNLQLYYERLNDFVE